MSGHAPSALEHPDIVSAEVAKLLQCRAVQKVTHLRGDVSQVTCLLGLVLAERESPPACQNEEPSTLAIRASKSANWRQHDTTSHSRLRTGRGAWRLCWDARKLNAMIGSASFKMETINVASRLCRPGDWMIVIDMKVGVPHGSWAAAHMPRVVAQLGVPPKPPL